MKIKCKSLPFLLSAVIWALSSTIAVAQCTADTYEEDDTCPSKTVICGSQIQSRNFCDDAGDFLSFNACAERSYTIETSNLGPAADTVLELYDTDCSTLLLSDDNGGNGGAGPASLITWTAPVGGTGTYHIKVRQVDGTFGDDRNYGIIFTAGVCSRADFNGDGCVDGEDLIQLGLRYDCAADGSGTCGTLPYDAAYDIGPLDPSTSCSVPDDKIDVSDLGVLIGEFGQGCP
jgi:hypothetical protein